jgi:hypothetical protein
MPPQLAIFSTRAGDGRADVVLKKDKLTVACEISISTTVEHEVANLTKCLQAKFSRIIFICNDKRRRTKIREMLASTQPETANIIFISPDDIVAALDQINPQLQTTEGTVRGYKVKVSRKSLSAADIAGRRAAVGWTAMSSLRRAGGSKTAHWQTSWASRKTR